MRRPGSPEPAPSTPLSYKAFAKLAIGVRPGRMTATYQRETDALIKPPCRAGSSPARTSDDFPLPDAPTTATNRVRRRCARSSSTCASRPKKRCSSSDSKGRSPGKRIPREPSAAVHEASVFGRSSRSRNGSSTEGSKPASASSTRTSLLRNCRLSGRSGPPSKTAAAVNGRSRP